MQAIATALPSRRAAIRLFTGLETHVAAPDFIKAMDCYPMVEQFSWTCFHVWALNKTLEKQPGPWLLRKNIKICLEEYTRDHSYQYVDSFDLNVYSELCRRRQTLFWALDDLYKFGLTAKPLEQIVEQDLLSEGRDEKKEAVKKAIQYIRLEKAEKLAEKLFEEKPV